MSILKKITYEHFLIYLLILFKMGHFFTDNMNSVTAPLLLFLLLFCKKRGTRSKTVIGVTLALFLLTNITYAATGFPVPSQYIVLIINLLTPVLFTFAMTPQIFMRKFSEVVLVVSAFSIVTWFLTFIHFPFQLIAPTLTNTNGFECQFIILSFIHSVSGDLPRLQGIAWEPGAFQILIIISMLYQMYNIEGEDKKLFTKNRIIYSIAAFLTFSTTAYICLLMVYAIFLLRGKISFKVKALILSITIPLVLVFLTGGGEIYQKVLGKKIAEAENYEMGSGSVGSSAVRIDGVLYPIMLYSQSPIVGVGDSGYETMERLAGHGMFTCTPINYFVKYGPIYGLFCFIGFLKLMRLNRKKFLESLFLILSLLMAVFSEQVAFNPLFTTLLLYGYVLSNR